MGLRLDHCSGSEPAKRLPQPEEVFLAWLLSVPGDADLLAAADAEIMRLGRYAGSHPGPARLLDLFEALRRSLGSTPGRPPLQ